ncbi:peroxisomal hydratase-dehydrogenase-epimerase [Ilyonectria destructans]|nr:peroxisomal hydratase-dehydrogenase-epimerase [Ilyonectria destructans]
MSELRFDGQVAVITGGGSGLGIGYAKLLASRGASIVVNDATKAADIVVRQIIDTGGKAVASYDSPEDGANIIQSAISAFGRIDILINNADLVLDTPFENLADQDWDLVNNAVIRGPYKTTQAAWLHFRSQKSGRIILTSSASGLYGSPGRSNTSSAKAAMVGFGKTLAKEGAKYNILTNIIAPVTATDQLPEATLPLVSLLVHQKNNFENGSIFEVDAGRISKVRWERAHGAVLKCDDSMTPGAILERWTDINDFSQPEYPNATADMMKHLKVSQQMKSNRPGADIQFVGKVAVVTGGGAGLGRAYCIQLAKRGAAVVVNDLSDPHAVVKEIQGFGGTAVANTSSVEDGDAVIKTAIDNFGRVDILINNAGILRDKSFQNMNDKLWNDIMGVHLRGTYKCTRAAYPYMIKQKYGRIVNTSSTSGIYGNYGQTNYAAAKTAMLGLAASLAIEGQEHNITINSIGPSAGTQLTRTVLSEELVKARKPDFVAPLVLLLCSDKIPNGVTGQIFEVGCGWQGQTRWQRSSGYMFKPQAVPTPEQILSSWNAVTDFNDGRAHHPGLGNTTQTRPLASDYYTAAIEKAKKTKAEGTVFSYTNRDAILYNVSLGADRNHLPLVYENATDFHVLPSFGVIPGTTAARPFNLEQLVPNFNFKMLLHGEHFLEIRKHPIPTSATLVSYPRLIEILDKGKASVAIIGTTTKDAVTGEEVFYNELSLFLRGSGGFGGPTKRTDNIVSATISTAPSGKPDLTVEQTTSPDQAILYRLNGDRNPLHIDPAASTAGGFKSPILHGLCSFGIATKHVVGELGPIKNIKARFVGTVTPGETLVTEMWKAGNIVSFQTRVKESGKLCISHGSAELLGTPASHL